VGLIFCQTRVSQKMFECQLGLPDAPAWPFFYYLFSRGEKEGGILQISAWIRYC